MEGGGKKDDEEVGDKLPPLEVGEGEHKDGDGDLVPDGAEGVTEKAEGDKDEHTQPHRGGMAVEENGVEPQADGGDAGGKDELGGAEEGDDIIQQAVADLQPVHIGLAEEEGEAPLADLLEVAQVHLVVHPHRNAPEDREGEHRRRKDGQQNDIVAAGGV